MRFMVEVDAVMEKAKAVDAAGGPGPMLAKIGQRFKPEAVYGRRHVAAPILSST